jgi:hypothetical protein
LAIGRLSAGLEAKDRLRINAAGAADVILGPFETAVVFETWGRFLVRNKEGSSYRANIPAPKIHLSQERPVLEASLPPAISSVVRSRQAYYLAKLAGRQRFRQSDALPSVWPRCNGHGDRTERAPGRDQIG